MAQFFKLAMISVCAGVCACLLAPAAAAVSDAAPSVPTTPAAVPHVYPAPVRLQYDLSGKASGFPYSAKAELWWVSDGNNYEARMEISHFLLGTNTQTSIGKITPQGLEPARFTSKFRNEVVVRFDRDKNKITFNSDMPEAPLLPGAQDQASVFWQAASTVAAAPSRYPLGSTLTYQTIGPRTVEMWTFTVGATEKLALPGGEVSAIRLWREAAHENDAKGEVWLAPSMDYLPVRIRLTKGSNEMIDQKWRATLKP
jgi:hypothetical protein